MKLQNERGTSCSKNYDQETTLAEKSNLTCEGCVGIGKRHVLGKEKYLESVPLKVIKCCQATTIWLYGKINIIIYIYLIPEFV